MTPAPLCIDCGRRCLPDEVCGHCGHDPRPSDPVVNPDARAEAMAQVREIGARSKEKPRP